MKKLADYAALSGPICVVITLAGWLVAGLLPLPFGPGDQGEIVHFFLDHPDRVKAGFVVASIGTALAMPLWALVSLHLFRMDRRLPLLALVQAMIAVVTLVINMFPQLIFAVAAFRTDRDPSGVVLLNDVAWLLLFTGIAPFMVQNVVIGIAILRDPQQLFPRWVAWLNFFVAFSFIPDPLAFFLKTGPFAWNGVFVFWLALTTYCVFIVVMCWGCLRANRTLAADLTPTPQGA